MAAILNSATGWRRRDRLARLTSSQGLGASLSCGHCRLEDSLGALGSSSTTGDSYCGSPSSLKDEGDLLQAVAGSHIWYLVSNHVRCFLCGCALLRAGGSVGWLCHFRLRSILQAKRCSRKAVCASKLLLPKFPLLPPITPSRSIFVATIDDTQT